MGAFSSRVSYLDSQIPYGNTPNDKRFEIWLLSCLISWIIGLISVYSYFSFTSLSHLSIISKRFPLMVKFECIMVMLNCFICWPVFALNGAHLEQFTSSHKTINIIAWFLYPFICHGIVDIEACRCWLMYFKLNNLYFTENKQWVEIINVDENSFNFWLTKQKTYGNMKWCIKRIFCYYLFTSFFSMIMINSFGYNMITQFIDAIFYAFPVIIVIFTYYKCPEIRDKFLFYFEFRTSAWLYTSGLTLYFCNATLFWFNMYYASVSVTFIGLYSIPSVSILSALIIPKKIMMNPLWNKHTHKDFESPKSVFSVTNSGLNVSLSDGDQHRQRVQSEKQRSAMQLSSSIQTIFKKPLLLQLFLKHTLKEFCAENILSYIEMKQFRDVFIKKCSKYVNDTENIDTTYCYQLPNHNEMPKSKIVFDKLDVDKDYENDDLKCVAQKIFIGLYEKYIAENAENEINISFELRKQYESYYINNWNFTLDEIIKLYDPILNEMSILLMDVKYRFINSKEFIMQNPCNVV
eukprot:27138_1